MLGSKTIKYSRSKDGCLSCKKLRIKCSEQKPSCKHCTRTNKICQYPSEGYNNQDVNLSALTINSAKNLLHISDFQYQLLHFHLNFGSSTLSKNDPASYGVWHDQIPALFAQNPLVRKSLYAISCLSLWSKYDLNKIHTVSYKDNGSTIYLYSETEKFFSDLMGVLSKMEMNGNIDNDSSIVFGYISFLNFLSHHPTPPIPLVDFSNSRPLDLFSVCKTMPAMIWRTAPPLEKTYMSVVPQCWTQILKESKLSFEIPIIDHLRRFINNEGSFNVKKHHESYLAVLNRISAAVDICFEKASPTIFSLSLPILITDLEDFCYDLRSKDYTAMKIIFYYSAITLILGLALTQESSIWSEYMTTFIGMWPNRDRYDYWLYECIVIFKFTIEKSTLANLKEFGKENTFAVNLSTI